MMMSQVNQYKRPTTAINRRTKESRILATSITEETKKTTQNLVKTRMSEMADKYKEAFNKSKSGIS